jgi:hypothetical protein
MNALRHRIDAGSLFFGIVLLFVGVFYILRNNFGWQLGEIDWDLIWPIIVLSLGASVVYKAWAHPKAS